jgi:hypothetical protein
MGEYYSELASALQERLEVISDQDLRTKDPEAQLRRLQLASERIDRLKQGLPADADPMLKHFLERMNLTPDFLADSRSPVHLVPAEPP